MDAYLMFKVVKVADLPNGYYKQQLTRLVEDPMVADVVVLAKEGHNDDWACYIGWPKYEHLKMSARNAAALYCTQTIRTAHQVMEHGDKFPEEEAKQLFPEITHLTYRE